jgi:hypothetical protein
VEMAHSCTKWIIVLVFITGVKFLQGQTLVFDYDSVLVFCSMTDLQEEVYKHEEDKEYAAEKLNDLPLNSKIRHDTLFCTEDGLADFEWNIEGLVRKKKVKFYDRRTKCMVHAVAQRKEKDSLGSKWWVYYDSEFKKDLFIVGIEYRVKF